jgi:tetratricopeptide (TPR) repeat protein
LTGRPGTGKTRLAWEVLRSSARATLWRRGAVDSPEPLPPLDRAIAAERQRPLWVVFDSLDGASDATWVEIADLVARPDFGNGIHALLIGRAGTAWPDPLLPAVELALGPLAGEEWERFCFQAYHGLALPLGVAERLAEHAAGNPFVLEEALHFLVRERQLRQVFGSFFFSGSEERAEFQPSSRLRLHVEAEAMRLAPPEPLRLLALAGTAVPSAELSAAVFAMGDAPPPRDWEVPALAAGFLEVRDGPWGEGLVLVEPVDGLALAGALDPADATTLRRALGELLAARSSTAEELWGAWPLLAGTDEGARTLLAATAAPGARMPRDEVFASLRDELASLGERGGDADLELDLLWALLPTARRLGRLHELEGAIDRGLELSRSRTDRFLAIAAVAAELHQKAGRVARAEAVLRRALAAAQGGDQRKQELLLVELARVLIRQGRRPEAQELLGKTLAAAERAGRRTTEATCLFLLGNIALHELRLAEAETQHLAALERRRAGGPPATVAASLSALGAVAFAQGNFPVALERYGEAQRAIAGEGAEGDEAYALLGVGRALLRLGAATEAAPELKRALALRAGRDDAVGEAIARVAVAEAHLALGMLEDAHQEARRALFTLSLLAEVDARADAERVLGHVLLRLRRPEEAAARLAEAERVYRAVGNDLAVLTTLGLALEAALGTAQAPRVEAAFAALVAERERTRQIASGALLDYPLHVAALWLRRANRTAPDPVGYLRTAYHELLRQTGFLEPAMRQRFLFQIPGNAAILDAATRAGLAMPPD